MPDVNSIPFRQANGNGHYESKQLPNDNTDFLAILGLPISLGNVTSVTVPSRDGQLVQYWQTGGLTIKGSTAIGVVDLVDGVVTTRTSPAGDIVGTLGAQTLNNKTLTNCVLTSPTGLTKVDVGLGNVDNTSDINKPISTAQQLALNLKEDKANKNVANGYAGLDATGKVVASQLPANVQGTVAYQGTWNATTNSPVIPAASAANKGWYYVVSVAGTVSISGVADWGVGDWLVSNGTTWDKADHTDAITSVSGRTGAVVLTNADVGLNNVDNTSDAQKNSAAGVLTNKTINGQVNTLTVRLDADVANNLPVNNLNNGIGATGSTWWCGDGQWKSPAGAGDVVGPAGAADGEVALFSLATGKLLKRATGSGVVVVSNGVYQTPIPTTQAFTPPGVVVSFAGITPPVGWLMCSGAIVSRTTYSDLFAVIGTTYGAGDGSTTFSLPDLRGRVLAGKDDMGGSNANRLSNYGTQNITLGGSGGAATHPLVVAELAVHAHGLGSHTHGFTNPCGAVASGIQSGSTYGNQTQQTGVTGSGSDPAGSGTAHNNSQPTMIMNKIIKY